MKFSDYFVLILVSDTESTDAYGMPEDTRLLKGRCNWQSNTIETIAIDEVEVQMRHKVYISPDFAYYFDSFEPKQGRLLRINESQFNNPSYRPESQSTSGSGRIVEIMDNKSHTRPRRIVRVKTT